MKCISLSCVLLSISAIVQGTPFYQSPPVSLTPTSEDRDCSESASSPWYRSIDNWHSAQVDKNLKTYISGGIDTDGTYWPGLNGRNLSAALAADIMDKPDWDCSIYKPCSADDLGCDDAINSTWGYLALVAMANMNHQLSQVYDAAGDSNSILANRASDITRDFRPYADVDSLSGLMKGLGILSLAASVLGAAFGLGGASMAIEGAVAGATGAAAGFAKASVASHAANRPVDNSLEEFRTFVGKSVQFFQESLEPMTADLFAGRPFTNSSTTIGDLLADGKWIRPSQNVSRTDLNKAFEADFSSRAINALWNNAPTKDTKMWITFADLSDSPAKDACHNDSRGPQQTKYCADGGVYYFYHFNETGHLRGVLDKPFGLDKFEGYGISPADITAASAKSYRAAPNGFDYDSQTNASQTITAASQNGLKTFLDNPAALEGTWTIPVCDIGKHVEWNFDYITGPLKNDKNTGHMPCMCGPKGEKTAAFVESARMGDFHTLPDWCHDQLKNKEAWPAGVDKVDYGYGLTIKKPH
ncbi:MAG: hypothetical protein M1814_005139 [Vezdaea aestivalis]|nr:MAG: hypothetical protein M1814_005139 [Vezdaea aestivalis]